MAQPTTTRGLFYNAGSDGSGFIPKMAGLQETNHASKRVCNGTQACRTVSQTTKGYVSHNEDIVLWLLKEFKSLAQTGDLARAGPAHFVCGGGCALYPTRPNRHQHEEHIPNSSINLIHPHAMRPTTESLYTHDAFNL